MLERKETIMYRSNNFNPLSGEFIITMSHLPRRVLNFKNPPCPAILLRVQKKI